VKISKSKSGKVPQSITLLITYSQYKPDFREQVTIKAGKKLLINFSCKIKYLNPQPYQKSFTLMVKGL